MSCHCCLLFNFISYISHCTGLWTLLLREGRRNHVGRLQVCKTSSFLLLGTRLLLSSSSFFIEEGFGPFAIACLHGSLEKSEYDLSYDLSLGSEERTVVLHKEVIEANAPGCQLSGRIIETLMESFHCRIVPMEDVSS